MEIVKFSEFRDECAKVSYLIEPGPVSSLYDSLLSCASSPINYLPMEPYYESERAMTSQKQRRKQSDDTNNGLAYSMLFQSVKRASTAMLSGNPAAISSGRNTFYIHMISY